MANEPDSLEMHLGPDGEPTFERLLLHASIVEDTLDGQIRNAKPRVVFTAGGPASGKSSLIKNFGLTVNAAHIDVDRIRLQLPEYEDWRVADPEQAAHRTHREASDIAKRIFAAALQQGINVVFDGVGADDTGKFSERIAATLAKTRLVEIYYATVPVDVAIDREDTRFAETGRRVPPDVLRAKHAEVSRGLANIAVLDVCRIQIYDTSGAQPKLLAQGPGGKGLDGLDVVDPTGYADFLKKGMA